jgi:hypothetical protein
MENIFEHYFTETLFYNNCKFEDVEKQIEKIDEEIKELKDAVFKWMNGQDTLDHVNEEGFDAKQSIFNTIEYVEANHNHLTKLLDRDLEKDDEKK